MPAGSESLASPDDIANALLSQERLALEAKRFRVVAVVGAILLAPQLVAHLLISTVVFPPISQMYADIGGELPGFTRLLLSLGPVLGIALALVDVLIFWACYRLARKYWIGLLLVPFFAAGAVSGIIAQSLYLPMFSVISLVQ